jgi:hypothetical protein
MDLGIECIIFTPIVMWAELVFNCSIEHTICHLLTPVDIHPAIRMMIEYGLL